MTVLNRQNGFFSLDISAFVWRLCDIFSRRRKKRTEFGVNKKCGLDFTTIETFLSFLFHRKGFEKLTRHSKKPSRFIGAQND